MKTHVLPKHNVARFIKRLASENNITDSEDRIDRLASTITRLSGDDVRLDSIERMMVTLGRKGILNQEDIFKLEENYLNERESGLHMQG